MDEKTNNRTSKRNRKRTNRPKPCDKELEKLRQDLESVRKEKDEMFDRLQRVYADYANFQKRVPKNIADTRGV